MYSCGPLHRDEQSQDVQLENTYSSSVTILDVARKTCQGQWTIGRGGERQSEISVLMMTMMINNWINQSNMTASIEMQYTSKLQIYLMLFIDKASNLCTMTCYRLIPVCPYRPLMILMSLKQKKYNLAPMMTWTSIELAIGQVHLLSMAIDTVGQVTIRMTMKWPQPNIPDWLIDFNSMSTCLSLFYI